MTSIEKSLVEEAIAKAYPFVVFQLPGKDRYAVVIQQNKQLKSIHYNQIDSLKGFIMAPFRGKVVNHFFCLHPDQYFEMNKEDEDIFLLLNDVKVRADKDLSVYEMSRKEYFDRAGYLVEILKGGELRKVVLSRAIEYTLPDTFKTGRYVDRLMKRYPKAFVYLASLPGHGLWVGATPEVLLKMEEDHAETVALAGTQDADAFNWTEKELKEQQIVMDYIEELLHNQGIHEYGRTGPYTVRAGNLVHLKTRYNLSLEQLRDKVGELIAGLHPTPAVCGLPRNKAYELIRKVEKHDRRFYSGFLGPWNLSGESQLYVNLRCAELSQHKMSLFAGGGFTAESNPEAEWEETVRKSETLLSVVEKS